MTPMRSRPNKSPAIPEPSTPPAQQIANGHATRAEWDEPKETGRVENYLRGGKSYVRQVQGFRRADPILALHRRSPNEFTRQHVQAAERLRDDHEIGQGVNLGLGSGGGLGPADAQLDAMARYRAAVQALGPRLWAIVDPVVIHWQTVAWWAEKFGRSEHKAAGYLIAALDALHDHYNPPVKNRVDTTASDRG